MKFQLRPYKSFYPRSNSLFLGRDWEQELDNMFNEKLRDPEGRNFYPLTLDAHEDEKEYQLKFDIPGLKKDEIQIELKDEFLIIKGERKLERKNATTSERWSGEFLREVKLPSNIDYEKVGATFEDGVLTVALGKQGQEKSRSIAIK